MNRAERRREERALDKGYSTIRDRAILAATGPMLESVYAAVILLMTEEYGFDHDQCLDLLGKLEDKTLYCLSHRDIVDEAFEKTGIRIRFRDGIDRIEEVTT